MSKFHTFIRWLGAYRWGPSLKASLEWETDPATSQRREVPAQAFTKKALRKDASRYWPYGMAEGPSRRKPSIGLLVDPKHVRKVYAGDVWSVPGRRGTLVSTRPPNIHGLWEAIVRRAPCNRYTAIVVRGLIANREAWRTLVEFSKKSGLPIIRFKPDGSKKVLFKPKRT